MAVKPAGQPRRGTAPRPERLTLAAYLSLPEEQTRCEFLRGWAVREPAPEELHQRVVGNLYWLLRAHLRRTGSGLVYLAPFDVVLSPDYVVQPDLVYVRRERAAIVAGRVEGAPDLAVEVVSRYSARKDRVFRLRLYARLGIGEYWIADPHQPAVEVYTLDTGASAPGAYLLHRRFLPGERLRSPLLPGFRPDVAAVFTADP